AGLSSKTVGGQENGVIKIIAPPKAILDVRPGTDIFQQRMWMNICGNFFDCNYILVAGTILVIIRVPQTRDVVMTEYKVKVDPSLNVASQAFGARVEGKIVFIPSKLAQVL